MKFKDTRMKIVNDILNGIKVSGFALLSGKKVQKLSLRRICTLFTPQGGILVPSWYILAELGSN